MRENYEQEYRWIYNELLVEIRDKILLIIVVALLGAAVGGAGAKALITPEYEASINLIVNMKSSNDEYITSDSISSAQTLAETYAIIIKSNIVLNQVIDDLKLDVTYDQLCNLVTVEAINETQVMKVSVHNEDADLAVKIVENISTIAPDIVVEAVEAGSCKVVSQVEVKEISPTMNIIKSMLICSFLVTVVYLAILVLRVLQNDYIVDDVDVENKLGILTLGIIPDLEEK